MEQIRRIPPCPDYDLEGWQSWLEDLAAEGYLPEKFGTTFTYFNKSEPKTIRYRLQPLPKKKTPPPEELSLAEEYGWTYVGTHRYFAVFSTTNPNTREFDTDPQVQAITMQQMFRVIMTAYFIGVLYWLAIIGFILWNGILHQLSRLPTLFTALLLLTIPFGLSLAIREPLHLFRLQWKLKHGQPLSPATDWKRNKTKHHAARLSRTVLAFALVLAAMFSNRFSWDGLRWKPVTTPPLFATLEDLSPDSRYEVGTWNVEHNNKAAQRATLLFRDQIAYEQYGFLHHADGTVSNCWYTVEYYDLRTEGMARALFRQIRRSDQTLFFWEAGYEQLPLPEIPSDQANFHRNLRPTLLLQDGTKVLRVEFAQYDLDAQYGDYPAAFLPDEQWISAVAQSIAE